MVQNRCFAETGWDFHVRKICDAFKISYQGFSLLTANPFVMDFPDVKKMAERLGVEPAQVVFIFAHQSGMIPLTGTQNPIHMAQDLNAMKYRLDSSELEFLLQCGLKE